MASSNRHWPSMFKSKPCNPHQWQHEINPTLMSSSCHRSSYTSGCEERSPEPKPRWNPKPEQIRILEAIFNSGMVNPPRDEIKKIRAQLQEYGQVGDANVFYWFQNRKSRSKHKQRNLQTASKSSSSNVVHQHQSSPVSLTAPSSSSSSSEKTSPKQVDKNFQLGSSGIHVIEGLNSPTASVNQTYFQTSTNQGGELISLDPFRFSSMVHQQQQQQQELGSSTNVFTQGFCFSELSNVVQFPNQDQEIGTTTYSGLLLGELLNHQRILRKEEEEEEKMKLMQQMNFTTSTTFSTPIVTTTSMSVPSPTTTIASTTPTTTSVNDLQGCLAGVGESGGIGHSTAIGQKSTVFINDVAFEVCGGPINIRQAFGYDAVLIHSSGQPVLMDEWGVTLHSLQPGALYYLLQV